MNYKWHSHIILIFLFNFHKFSVTISEQLDRPTVRDMSDIKIDRDVIDEVV